MAADDPQTRPLSEVVDELAHRQDGDTITLGEVMEAFGASALAGLLLVFGLACTWLLGPSNIPNVLLGICNQVVSTGLIAYISLRELPFSQPQATNMKGGNFLRGLMSLLLPGCLGFAHYLLFDYTIAVTLLLLMSAAAAWLCLDGMRNKSWEKITRKEYEG